MNASIRKLIKTLLFVLISMSMITYQYAIGFAAETAKTAVKENRRLETTEIIVKYMDDTKAESSKSSLKGKLKLSKLDSKKKIKKHKMELLQISDTDNLDTVVNQLRKDPNVVYAQPNYPVTINALPNDTYFERQWGLANSGQTVEGLTARTGVDINIQPAWDIAQGNPAVVVGVLDTGIDVNHEDLTNNIYLNTGEVAGNGIDDDGNGYIDDVKGWNFVNGTNQVFDSNNPAADTHGTQVAGIIASSANNGRGISGIAPKVKILPLKFIDGTVGYTSDAIDAIDYAMSRGVKIINCSFTGGDNNFALKDAMQNSGILFVSSGGNTGLDVTQTPVYPASFGLANVISVAAIDGNGVLANFSTYGSEINVAAPGVNILTTTPGSNYDYLSGTSASTPFVTGTAALILSQNPLISISDIKARIINNVVPCTNLQGKVSSGGRVDARAALLNTPPSSPDTYMGDGWNNSTVDGGSLGGDADSWYTTDQLAKVKQQIHYGESGVNPATGNFSFTVNDMSLTSPGFMINISRTYNSQDENLSLLGKGWRFGFEGSAIGINERSDMVVVTLPNGGLERFVKNTDGSYTANDSRGAFVKNEDGTFRLTTKDQYTYCFNSKGYLIWMADRNGNTVEITIDNSGKVSKIKDQAERVFTIAYNSDGLISQITDQAQRTVKYTYTNKRLTQVTDPMGRNMNYAYNTQGHLTKITDNDNKVVEELTYDHSDNSVRQVTDANGDTVVYSYANKNKKTSINENNGARLWTYWYDDSYYITKVQDPEGKTAVTNYFIDSGKNKYGDIQSTTDRYGNLTTYGRDGNGNITKVTNPDQSINNYQFDSKNNLIMEQDGSGKESFYIYDANEKKLILKVQPLDGSMQYRLSTGMDGSGKYTFSIYDLNNTLLLLGEPINGNIIYAPGSDFSKFAITTYGYYSDAEAQGLGYKAKGLLKTETDPEGGVTTYTYDTNGETATITDPEGKVTTTHYNDFGWKEFEISPGGFRTDYTYDKNGLLLKTRLNNGEITRTVYDAMGRKIQEISPNEYQEARDNTSPGADTYSDNAAGTRYTYYVSGLLATVTDALNNKTTYTYDVYGNMLTETKHNGSVYLYAYDAMDRLIKISFQENGSASPVVLEEYTYATLENHNTQKTRIKYLNAADKAITVYTYDYAERLISQQNPDGTVTKTRYNANGSIQNTTDEKGSITYYKYDGLNRLTEQWTPAEISNGTILYSYTKTEYDRAGRKTAVKTGKDKVALYSLPSALMVVNNTYYKNGNLKSVTDSAGRKSEYFYDNDGNVSEEDVYTDPTSRNITEYTYNQMGDPLTKKVHVQAGDLAGNDIASTQDVTLTTTYSYDKNGNLTTVTTPDDVTTTYTYDALNRQTSTSQPGLDEHDAAVNIVTSTTYDWEGKPLTKVDANGKTSRYAYNQRGFMVSETDAKDGVTAYYYDLAGRKTAEISPLQYSAGKALDQMNRTEYLYDLADRVTAKIDRYVDPVTGQWRSVTGKTYTYDAKGKVVREQDGLGAEGNYGTEYTYDLAGLQTAVLDPVSQERGLPYTIKYTYDGLGRKVTETNAKGILTKYTYDDAGNITAVVTNGQTIKASTYDLTGNIKTQKDGNGNTTAFTYNALGKLKSAVYPGDDTIPQNTVTYQYDKLGNLAYTKDATDKVNRYTYDNQGRETSHTEEKSDGSQPIITSVKYDKKGNKRFETDGNGVTVEKTYDELDRLVSAKIAIAGIPQTTAYSYDANGNQLTATDWRGNTNTNIYDPLNRLIEKKDPYGKTIQKLTYNNNNAQSESIDALGNMVQYAYDKNNRLIRTTDPEGHVTSQTYDNAGNINTKTDGRGITTTFKYDAFNRLAAVVDPKLQTTSFTYDVNGNLLTQTDGNGNTTTYAYNAANKAVKKIDQGGRTGSAGEDDYNPAKTETYTYYADGTMAAKTDRNGSTFVYVYDIHGRLVSESTGGSSNTYTYDNNGNQLTMEDSTGITTRTYDEMNRALTKTVPGMGTSTYEYDIITGVPEGFTAEKTTDPKGNITQKTYDKTGRLSAVTADGKTTTYLYYDNGNRQSVIYPDGSKEEYTYYQNNLNKTLTNKKADGTVIDTYSYTYDEANNQTSKTDGKGLTTYTYDSLNRLESVTETNGKITRYTFDKAGNRLTEAVTIDGNTGVTIYTYNEQNRLMSTMTIDAGTTQKVTYTYDNNGNMTSSATATVKTATEGAQASVGISLAGQSATKDVTFNQYNSWNNLIKTTVGDNTVTNTYNGDGLRVSKKVNNKTTNYLYEYDRVVLETDGQGNESARNVYGTNLLARTDGSDTYYYMYNGHGDVTALLNPEGQIPATYYYDAFGNITDQTVTGEVYQPVKYAGYYFDDETGLYYLNARYYDPKIARFLTEDTYTGDPNDPLSLNLYTYCKNEPIMYIDPTGHFWEGVVNTIKQIIYDISVQVGKTSIKGRKSGKVVSVPLRRVAYAYEASVVAWDEKSKQAMVTCNGKTFWFSTKDFYTENGEMWIRLDTFKNKFGIKDTNKIQMIDPTFANKVKVVPADFTGPLGPSQVRESQKTAAPTVLASHTGDKNVDIAYTKWWDTHPQSVYKDDMRYSSTSVAAFQNKLLYMSKNGVDVSKLSTNDLYKLFEDEANFQADATLAMSGAAVGIAKNAGTVASKVIAKEETIKAETLISQGTRADAIKDVDNLPKEIQDSVTKFFKEKATNKYTDFIVEKSSEGNYIMKMTKPGDVPGSKAIYYKKITPDGKTLDVFKESFDPAGNLIHNKNKIK